MRNRLAWIGGAAGGFALLRFLTGRRKPTVAVDEPAVDPRAEELRRKLDESRPLVEEREEFEAAETPVDEVEPAPLDERRRDVHERARSATERMRSPRGE